MQPQWEEEKSHTDRVIINGTYGIEDKLWQLQHMINPLHDDYDNDSQ